MLARGTERGGRGGGYWREGAYEYNKAGIWGNAPANGGKGISEGRSEMERTIVRQLVERAKEGKAQDRGESRRHKRQKCPECTPEF